MTALTNSSSASIRFKLLGGALDQCAGILFNAPVSGKVGVWPKTDSISEFAEFVVKME